MLAVHTEIVDVIVADEIAGRVRGLHAVHHTRTPGRHDGTVACQCDLVVRYCAVAYILGQEDSVAADRVKRTICHRTVRGVLNEERGVAMYGPITARRHLVVIQKRGTRFSERQTGKVDVPDGT